MANHFDCFSVLFGRGELYIGGESFPLGQCATDILNLDGAVLTELDRRVGGLMPAAKNLFDKKNRQRRPLRAGAAERCLGFDI